jgi:hypothetical protein
MNVGGELRNPILRQREGGHASGSSVPDNGREIRAREAPEALVVGESRAAIAAGGFGAVADRAVLNK